MKLLLTSGGVTNASIERALVSVLGKPIADSTALCIPTAAYAMRGGPDIAWRLIHGEPRNPLCELGWKSVGVLELTALPTIDRNYWVPAVEGIDALLVGGGDSLYLGHWMRESGLASLLPSLSDAVYVGLSAGSMVMAPRVGQEFVGWKPPSGRDDGLGIVDFAIFPHLDHEQLPQNTMAHAERWARKLPGRRYAIDDDTAICVTDGTVDVISEGHWRLFDEE